MQLKYNRRGALEALQGRRSEENQKSPLLSPRDTITVPKRPPEAMRQTLQPYPLPRPLPSKGISTELPHWPQGFGGTVGPLLV